MNTKKFSKFLKKTKKYTGKEIKKKVDYVLRFKLDDFGQKKEIEKKGLYVIQF